MIPDVVTADCPLFSEIAETTAEFKSAEIL
jgi:hypothetical protein